MTAIHPSTSDRIKSAIATIAIQALIAYALIAGLAMTMPHVVVDDLSLFRVAPSVPPPPPRPVAPPTRGAHPERAASPPNLRAQASEIVAPIPVIQIVLPPILTATTPGTGTASNTGAADVHGPGTGSGGIGNGNGGGGIGNGGNETPPRWRKGAISDADFPKSALARAGDFRGTVSVRYTVAVNGHVTACTVTRSSGDADVDATTCRLIEKRFRFDPSRDADGRAIPVMIVENHSWDIEHDRPAPRS